MPQLRNWPRVESPAGFRKAWRNEKTGEIVAITEETDDGYFAYRFEPGEECRVANGEQIGANRSFNRLRRRVAISLRANTSGIATE